MRIIVITVIIHVIALPIAAHFGAFDKIKQQFSPAKVTLVNLPKETKEKPVEKEKKAKPKPEKTASKAVAKKGGVVKPDPSRQKVVAVNTPDGAGAGDGPSIVQGDRTGVGEVPLAKIDPGTAKTGDGTRGPDPVTIPKTTEVKQPPVEVKPLPPVEPPKPKHIPVYAEPELDVSPQPVIPDDLRAEPLEKNFIALFTVGSDGKPTDIKTVQSTGNSELDAIALKTAKQWRFKPASLDGQGVESKVKLTIEFRVE